MTKPIPFTAFREMLLLPLRLHRQDDRGRLESLIAKLGPEWAHTAGSMAEVPMSKIARPPTSAPGAPQDDLLTQAYGEMVYFHPYVQSFLYGRGGEPTARPISTFRRTGVSSLRLHAGYRFFTHPDAVDARSFSIELAVERIELHHVRKPGLVVLAVELACDAGALLARFDGDGVELPGNHRPGLPEVLLIKDTLRRLYPPYFEELGPGCAEWNRALFPQAVVFDGPGAPAAESVVLSGDEAYGMARRMVAGAHDLPVAPWWRELFSPLWQARASDGTPLLRQVVDERMPTLSFLAVPKGATIDPADIMRLCFCDGPGEGMPYDEHFLRDFDAEHCYDRFRRDGTRYLFSHYSMTVVTQTGVQPGAAPSGFDFGLSVVQEHARRHYLRMMMLAQIQKTAMLAFSNWISQAMGENSTLRDARYRATIDELRHAFGEFTQVGWFSNVSNQEQARDLFALMQKHLGNGVLRDDVERELESARALLAEIDQERQAETGVVLNAFVAVASVLGIPSALVAVAQPLGISLKPLQPFAPAAITGLLLLAGTLVFLLGSLHATGSFVPRRRWGLALRRPGFLLSLLVAFVCVASAVVVVGLG